MPNKIKMPNLSNFKQVSIILPQKYPQKVIKSMEGVKQMCCLYSSCKKKQKLYSQVESIITLRISKKVIFFLSVCKGNWKKCLKGGLDMTSRLAP